MTRVLSRLILASSLTGSALAQSGTATWQCSIDHGANWVSDVELDTPRSIRVRLLMGWSLVPDALGLGGSQFDAIVIGGRPGDNVTDITRPRPFNFAAQTLVASTYAEGIKIDANLDTAPPGAGAGWIACGQNGPEAGPTDFNSSNPVVVFTYTLNIGSDTGTRHISNIFNDVFGRALAVYTSTGTGLVRMSAGVVENSSSVVTVVPTPSTLGCMAGLCALGSRRFRR